MLDDCEEVMCGDVAEEAWQEFVRYSRDELERIQERERGIDAQVRKRELASAGTFERWPNERLQEELNRLRTRYFPQLVGHWTVQHKVIERDCADWIISGRIFLKEHHILIDLSWPAHRSARKVRATLLHELCHASVDGGHGPEFFVELERLFREGAPIQQELWFYGEHHELFKSLPECQRRYERQRRRRNLAEVMTMDSFTALIRNREREMMRAIIDTFENEMGYHSFDDLQACHPGLVTFTAEEVQVFIRRQRQSWMLEVK